MLNIDLYERDNIKVLGLLVRYKRIKLGYSLRSLGDLTNISHTLISNFERGIMIPHEETLKEIFKVLNLEFYDKHEVLNNFTEIYNKIFKHILFYEYKAVTKLINILEKDRNIYENSKEVINFTIIRCLYYVLTNTYIEEKDKILEQYEVVLDFFSDNQKQLFYFIRGLDKLNQEFYKDTRDYFEKALKIGDQNIDLIIKEHYVVALSKSNMFIDSRLIAEECILEYEIQTNYIRAMRLRTRIAFDYIRMNKFDKAIELYKYVYDFSIKFKVKDLENRCNTRFAQIAVIRKDYDLAESYLNKVTPEFAKIYYYLKFDVLAHNSNDREFLKFFNETMGLNWVKKHRKSEIFFKLILMKYDDKYMNKKEFERLLVEQISIGLKSDDAEMISVASKFLFKFYKKERKYKKSMETAENLLHYLRFSM